MDVVMLSSDESDIDDNAPILSLLANKPKQNTSGDTSSAPQANTNQTRSVRHDFVSSSDSDDELPDLPSCGADIPSYDKLHKPGHQRNNEMLPNLPHNNDDNKEFPDLQYSDELSPDLQCNDLPDLPCDEELPDLPCGYDDDMGYFERFDTNRHDSPISVTTTDTPCSTTDSYDIDMSTQTGEATVSEVEKVRRKKRTAEEIEEQRQLAQTTREKKSEETRRKREEKQNKKLEEARERKLRNEVSKQNRATDCQKYVTVLVDTGVVNQGYGSACIDAFASLESSCITQPLSVKDSIQWKRRVDELSQTDNESPVDMVSCEVLEREIMLILGAQSFTDMVHAHKQTHNCDVVDSRFKPNRQGRDIAANPTLIQYIQSVRATLPQSCITLVIMGMDKYFRQQKTQQQRQHRQDVLRVTGDEATTQPRRKKGDITVLVSKIDVEECLMEAQLDMDCNAHMLETPVQLADLVKSFTKAVAEAPIKKDRMESAFSFHCEPLTGVKVDKNGQGLLKIWKNQMRQFRAVSADMADAIVAAYPSPQLLIQAYENCSSQQEADRLLENIQVRRGAGLLETNRRIGKELSRRVHTHMTCTDPTVVIK